MTVRFLATSALALASLPAPAAAQMHMPGMHMPAPAKPATKKMPAAKKKAAVKKKAAAPKEAPAPKARAQEAPPPPPAPTDHGAMDHGAMDPAMHGGVMDHSQIAHPPMAETKGDPHAGHAMAVTGAFGPYPMTRESSGTAWQPDESEHSALHVMSGDWTLMAHGVAN
ncbi:MAG TPA: hypothetical protein VM145_06615, partial [Sphingomicrobium sp.]|nr:hypothetical protein [Sphingomicrobium sp.]